MYYSKPVNCNFSERLRLEQWHMKAIAKNGNNFAYFMVGNGIQDNENFDKASRLYLNSYVIF